MNTCTVLQAAGSYRDVGFSSCAAVGIQGRSGRNALPTTRLHGDDGGMTFSSGNTWPANYRSPLLSLPPELRRQIYHWVFLMTPVRNGSPDPAYPAPEVRRCELRCLTEDQDVDDDDDDEMHRVQRPPRLLCPDRPLCGVPTSLLRSCRQVYDEVRMVPFESNEFVFATWFASGLVTAHAIVTGVLRPWQRRAMRYVRMEALGRELQGEAALQTWAALSETWAGLRGLRVRIASPSGGDGALNDLMLLLRSSTPQPSERRDANEGAETRPDWELVGRVGEEWAAKGGLAHMRGLERLEVELAVPTWSTQTKLDFCTAVQRMLRQGGSRAVVVCTTSDAAVVVG
ncbi:hypothetical protein JDV02_009447 [Purpureocillium takamizusanense]|uniref:DUF7730 domain-containing protein n=1 Tax=Purpureocillium takamizusanense TaxID=2060973 RepID=A0A9Q8QPZ5_9HYPO|nr:uncharacterized protein JDV02_009447 [Purpureocillium takamizusanense]UNI23640.1 hypothetical protein JDV02_009447 [Purpureocillium takamizusanense]